MNPTSITSSVVNQGTGLAIGFPGFVGSLIKRRKSRLFGERSLIEL